MNEIEIDEREPTMGDAYDAMTPEARRRAFFLLLDICKFYGSADTWFATCILADPPAGLITTDFHMCADLNHRAPGGRARIAMSWILSSMERALSRRGQFR